MSSRLHLRWAAAATVLVAVIGAVAAPGVATVVAMPLVAGVAVAVVGWLPGRPWGWLGLVVVWLWASSSGVAMWFMATGGFRPPDSSVARAGWIEPVSLVLVVVYFLVILGSLALIREVRDQSVDAGRGQLLLVTAAVLAVVLFQTVFSLNEYNYPG